MHTETTGAAGGVTGYVPAQRQFLRFRGEESLENTVYRNQPLDDF
jgi:hypothetical protein